MFILKNFTYGFDNMLKMLEEVDEEVSKAVDLIKQGFHRDFILKKIKAKFFSKEKIFEMAKCRIRARKKFGEMASYLFFDEEALRYATPPEVAEYRAKRVGGGIAADICCGVGMQLMYFSKYADKVIGVEIDKDRAKMAELNLMVFGAENFEIMEGDALSMEIFNKIYANSIFCDPSRKPEEKKRTFETLLPNPMKVYELYQKKTDRIAFELPPQMRREEIKIEGEKEYTSLNFDLNRLALYTRAFASCNISAVSLPSEERVTDEDDEVEIEEKSEVADYIYEVDRTIIKAGLLKNLAGKIGFDGFLPHFEERRTLLSSENKYISSFLRAYKVVESCKFEIDTINRVLKKCHAGKATPRFSIEPKEYWKVRNRIEDGLKGERRYYIFKVGGKAIIAEKL